MTAPERAELRRALEGDLLAEALRIGPDRVRRSDVVRRFADKGVPRATCYQWCAEYFDSGRLGQAMARSIRESADARAAAAGITVSEASARQAGEAIPKPTTASELLAATTGRGLNVIAELAAVVEDVKVVRGQCFGPDGKPRNPRLLLRTADEMRRALETAVKLQTAMNDLGQLERFHQAVIAEVAAESPELAQRVLTRLTTLAISWGAP